MIFNPSAAKGGLSTVEIHRWSDALNILARADGMKGEGEKMKIKTTDQIIIDELQTRYNKSDDENKVLKEEIKRLKKKIDDLLY